MNRNDLDFTVFSLPIDLTQKPTLGFHIQRFYTGYLNNLANQFDFDKESIKVHAISESKAIITVVGFPKTQP